MIVVKVGGSLYDFPTLQNKLRAYICRLTESEPVIIAPGGGRAADEVRKWDGDHQLGEEASHCLAVQSLTQTGMFLQQLLSSDNAMITKWDCRSFLHHVVGTFDNTVNIICSHAWLQANDTLPHSWAVTSDSIAAHVALTLKATRLILLKSIDVPADCSWQRAADENRVDAHFPALASQLACPIDIVNFRTLRFDEERVK